jgi:hypothetical protein
MRPRVEEFRLLVQIEIGDVVLKDLVADLIVFSYQNLRVVLQRDSLHEVLFEREFVSLRL